MAASAGYREVYHSKPWQYEEDGLTVTNTQAWTAPGCHIGCDVKLYTDKDGKLRYTLHYPNDKYKEHVMFIDLSMEETSETAPF